MGIVMPELLTVKDVCSYLGLGETVVREMIRTGEIPHIRVRSSIRVDANDLKKYLKNNKSVVV